MTLNEEQAAAVHSKAKRTIVIAGPGSGKSRVVVERILYLITERDVNPKHIIVLTYTNAAAHVLVERLAPRCAALNFVGTLHGFCLRLIQAHGALIGYRAGSVSLVTEEAKKTLLAETKKRLGSKISDRKLEANDSPEAKLICDEYTHTLKRSNMLDYDRILFEGHKLLCNSDVRAKLQIAACLVDEAQDSAPIDWDCYDMIPADFIVGDGDQSIFGWRGAHPEMLVEAAEEGGVEDDTKTFVLPTNYRSDALICEAASKLIRYNSNRVDKPTVPVPSATSGELCFVPYEDGVKEIFGCAYQIKEAMAAIAGAPGGYSEIAVLARTNALADFARETLRGLGLPIKETGKIRMPEDWGFALACVSLMVDPSNDYHAERVMKGRGIHQLEINTAKLKALRDGTSLATTAKIIQPEGKPTPTYPTRISDAMYLLTKSGVSVESYDLIEKRIDVLPNANPVLSDLLADLWKNDTWNREEEGEGIFMGTIHSAKGKEFDYVHIIGCEEGILPSAQSIKAAEGPGGWQPIRGGEIMMGSKAYLRSVTGSPIDEDRRLMYVAMTRARHTLILSWARERTAYFKTTTQTPSRFLQECQ